MSAVEKLADTSLTTTVGSESFGDRAANVIEDPFASAAAGMAAPAAAFGFVISAMYGLALVF